MRALIAVVVAGCWTGPSATPTPPAPFVCPQPSGTPSDYTHPVIAGITTALEMCGDMSTNEGRIRVSRARGTRTIGEGCVTPPEAPTACPVVHPGLVLALASQELSAAGGVAVNGTGMSTCSTWVRGEYEFSISTDRWTDAAEVVRRVAEILDRYDIAGSTNVAIRHIPCTVALAIK